MYNACIKKYFLYFILFIFLDFKFLNFFSFFIFQLSKKRKQKLPNNQRSKKTQCSCCLQPTSDNSIQKRRHSSCLQLADALANNAHQVHVAVRRQMQPISAQKPPLARNSTVVVAENLRRIRQENVGRSPETSTKNVQAVPKLGQFPVKK